MSTGQARKALATAGLVSTAVAALMLGPVLGPGVTIAYDMPWSPRATLTPFALGVGTPAPRAVPSDAIVFVLSWLLGPGVAQSLVLLTILATAGLGAAVLLHRLSPRAHPLALVAAALAGTWNPFVVERLAIGQWVVLLGYAAIPWALASLSGPRRAGVPSGLLVAIGVASLGGANPLAMIALAVLPVLAVQVLRRGAWRDGLWVVGSLLGTGAVWILPSLAAHTSSAPMATSAFAPRADTPFGVLISLFSAGGFWNPASHPAPRGQWASATAALLLAVVAAVLVCRLLWSRHRPLLASIGAAWLIVLLSSLPWAEPLWSRLVQLPGGGLLRDSQKFVGVWAVLLAVGCGLGVQALMQRRRRAVVVPLAVGLALAPMALLPTAAWGLGGRLTAVHAPTGLLTATETLSAAPPGVVGVLPWGQYRRYAWNSDHVSLTLLPRMVRQPTLFDDSLPLFSGVVPGEDARAARVSRAMARGVDPVAALASEGVTYVAMERRAGLPSEDLRASGSVMVDTPELLVVSLTGSADQRRSPSVGAGVTRLTTLGFLGWGVTILSWVGLVLHAVSRGLRVARRPPSPLLESRP